MEGARDRQRTGSGRWRGCGDPRLATRFGSGVPNALILECPLTKGNTVLQRILAALLIVVGLAGAGYGVASATVWRDSDTVVATATTADDGALLVTDPGVLELVGDDVTIRATAPGDAKVTLAIGRDVDVDGWVGADAVTRVTGLTDWETLTTRAVAAKSEVAAPDAAEAPADGTEPPADTGDGAVAEGTVAADPEGSDMWVAQATGAGSANLRWSAQPGRWNLLVATSGEAAGAPTLELSWPREVSTPWLWPGVVIGALLVLAGVLLLVVNLRSRRRPAPARREDADDPDSTEGGDGTAPDRAGAPASADGRSGAEPAPGVGREGGPRGMASEPEAVTRIMTRREIREQEEAQRAAARPRRNWLTGQIPIVPKEKRPPTGTLPLVGRRAPGTARGDAWRKAWGFSEEAPPADGQPGENGSDRDSGTDDTTRGTR